MKSYVKKTVGILYTPIIILLSIYIAWYVFSAANSEEKTPPATANTINELNFAPPNENDILVGKDTARLKVVIYTDYECPFCYEVGIKLKKWVEEFGEENIAFYLRHLPLTTIHSKAFDFALDAECSRSLYGDDTAFRLGLYMYENRNLELSKIRLSYPLIDSNINETSLEECRVQTNTKDQIELNAYEALINELNRTPSLAVYDAKKEIYIGKLTGGGANQYYNLLKTLVKGRK